MFLFGNICDSIVLLKSVFLALTGTILSESACAEVARFLQLVHADEDQVVKFH